jgi:hypothetical protein
MPSKVTVSVVLVTVVISGCVAIPSATTAPPANKSLPDRPTSLTERNVSDYVTVYEEVTIYNKYAEHDPTEDKISCRSDTRVTLDSAFVMNVQCTGGVALGDGNHVDVAASTHYYVSENTTRRIGTDDIRSVRYQEYRSDGPNLTSFEVVNLANDTAALSVEFDRSDGESPLRFDYDIAKRSGVGQVGLPFEYGTTREMRVRTANATTTAQFTSERVEFASPTVIYLLPDGRIRVTVGSSEIR